MMPWCDRVETDWRIVATTILGPTQSEYTGILAIVPAGHPDVASGISEGLPLSREVVKMCQNTKEEGIEIEEPLGTGNLIGQLQWGMHLYKDFFWKYLRDSWGMVR